MENLYLPANHFARRWREIVQMSLITGWLIWTVQNFQSCRAKDSALEIHRPLWTVLVRIADLARVRNTICQQHCLFVWSFVYLTTCLLLRCSRISVTFSAFLTTYFFSLSTCLLVYFFTCLVAYLFTCLQFFFKLCSDFIHVSDHLKMFTARHTIRDWRSNHQPLQRNTYTCVSNIGRSSWMQRKQPKS